jgi:hypothetical protein
VTVRPFSPLPPSCADVLSPPDDYDNDEDKDEDYKKGVLFLPSLPHHELTVFSFPPQTTTRRTTMVRTPSLIPQSFTLTLLSSADYDKKDDDKKDDDYEKKDDKDHDKEFDDKGTHSPFSSFVPFH